MHTAIQHNFSSEFAGAFAEAVVVGFVKAKVHFPAQRNHVVACSITAGFPGNFVTLVTRLAPSRLRTTS
jgi:hypothetical protein